MESLTATAPDADAISTHAPLPMERRDFRQSSTWMNVSFVAISSSIPSLFEILAVGHRILSKQEKQDVGCEVTSAYVKMHGLFLNADESFGLKALRSSAILLAGTSPDLPAAQGALSQPGYKDTRCTTLPNSAIALSSTLVYALGKHWMLDPRRHLPGAPIRHSS